MGAYDFTSSVVALRLLDLKGGSNLTPLIEGTPTTQEVETTRGLRHERVYCEWISEALAKVSTITSDLFGEVNKQLLRVTGGSRVGRIKVRSPISWRRGV